MSQYLKVNGGVVVVGSVGLYAAAETEVGVFTVDDQAAAAPWERSRQAYL